MFGTYVHNLDPVAVSFGGPIALRWYGLAYLGGFIAAYFLLKWLAKRDLWVLKAEQAGDFVAACALFGVFLGGRLGYILFYQIPAHGWDTLLHDPLMIFRVWEGGMASHGGILGLFIFTWFYASKHKVSWTGLGDGLCAVAPIGLFFGRIANFVNGELYGRVAHGVNWAMKFPRALTETDPERRSFESAMNAVLGKSPASQPVFDQFFKDGNDHQLFEGVLAAGRKDPVVMRTLEPYLEPRHPSQLYEALLEGALLFAILWFVRVRFPKAPHGTITGLFFGLYAMFRIFGERFREPDVAWVIDGVLTKGQFLSLFMFIFAAAFLITAWKRGHRTSAP